MLEYNRILEKIMSGMLKTPRSLKGTGPANLRALAGIKLIEDDGEPMESDWHVKAMGLLVNSINYHFRDRDDFYAAGNMFLYFSPSQVRNNDFRGPDFFFVWDTHRRPMRKYWAIWVENFRTPNVVIELCSPTTIKEDYGRKKDVYGSTLHVNDYFCYDPETGKLEGWRLKRHKYVPLKPNGDGRLWSKELGLWVGPWRSEVLGYEDRWLRFFDKDGRLVLDSTEAECIRTEEARLDAKKADERARAAESEVAALQAKLASLEVKAKNGSATNGKGKKKK
jgi:Uma2 family endonuclease